MCCFVSNFSRRVLVGGAVIGAAAVSAKYLYKKEYFSIQAHMDKGRRSLLNRVHLPQVNKEFWLVNGMFPENTFTNLESIIKTTDPEIKKPQELREFLFPPILFYEFVFSSSHVVQKIDDFFLKKGIYSVFMRDIYKCLLSRFGSELKLEGARTISIQFVRYTPESGRTTSQGWHFDFGAHSTMVVVLQNDFSCANEFDRGLDIGFNAVNGPFDPKKFSQDEDASPQNGIYTSVSYPRNGAIIFKGEKGHIIHRMSTLAAHTFPPNTSYTRTIVQLILKDDSWADLP